VSPIPKSVEWHAPRHSKGHAAPAATQSPPQFNQHLLIHFDLYWSNAGEPASARPLPVLGASDDPATQQRFLPPFSDPGHDEGIFTTNGKSNLTPQDKSALIEFLKTL
jgi:hypothetical protein